MANPSPNAGRQPKRKMLTMDHFKNNRELPLNLILLITAHLDDVADISRVTRTSRLLYYMTLPRLWEHVTLRSYSELRYKNGRPEGYGGGSPFSMALDALVSRNVAGYVKSFSLVGEWREMDVDEFSKGRVPDNTMMLNIAIKAALDKMDKLQSFSWELNTKPLRMIYQALASKKTLTSFTLKFPSNRIPRPTVVIPPMPNLKYIYAYDIDPLCYPDDISMVLAHATSLEELKIEWSPRMRREREPSVSLSSYWGRTASAGVSLPIKRLTYKNMYTRNDRELAMTLDFTKVESITFLNCINPGDPTTVFYDATWRGAQNGFSKLRRLKKLRIDATDDDMAQALSEISGLEEFYLVNRSSAFNFSLFDSISASGSPVPASSSASTNPGSKEPNSTPITPTAPVPPPYRAPATIAVASEFLAALSAHHGHSLKILLLCDQWKFSKDALVNLTKSCPNLQQFGVGIDGLQFETAKVILPNIPRLWAFRILENVEMHEYMLERAKEVGALRTHVQQEVMSREFWREEYRGIRVFGLGAQAFELGRVIEGKGGDALIQRRAVRYLTWEEAKTKAEIFGMDSLDI